MLLSNLVDLNVLKKGFEPLTQRFSVFCSTAELFKPYIHLERIELSPIDSQSITLSVELQASEHKQLKK